MAESLSEKIIADHKNALKSVNVTRTIPPVIDNHLLTIFDDNIIDPKQSTLDRCRDATQLIMNRIFEDLPHEQIEGSTYAILPKTQQNIFLPREKPCPEAKKKTKWEQFAETKGIQKRKKSRLVYDEDTKQWIPSWGYKSKRHQKDKEWAIEVPKNMDENTDMFKRRSDAKKSRVDKNEFQRLRNIARNSTKKADTSKLGVNPVAGGNKSDLDKAFHIAKKSTASLGKFDKKVSKMEDEGREKGKKRKFQDNTGSTGQNERDRFLSIAGEISKGKAVLNTRKATGRFMAGEQGEAGTGKKKQKLNQVKGKIGMKAKTKKAQRAGRNGKK